MRHESLVFAGVIVYALLGILFWGIVGFYISGCNFKARLKGVRAFISILLK